MPAYLLGWYPDYIDPDNYTAAFAGTAGSKGIGINFSDPAWDKMFVQGQTETDMKKRTALYEKIQQMWTDEVPTTTIFQGTLYLFAQKNIRGILHFSGDPLPVCAEKHPRDPPFTNPAVQLRPYT
jgi:peptide/nickel transport system substrate-binding protein